MTDRSERYDWRGMENILFPSSLADGSIDEDAIRLDVRNSIAHGFRGIAPAPVRDRDRFLRVLEVVADEAQGALHPTVFVGGVDDLDLVARAEAAGCRRLFLSIRVGPDTDEDALRAEYLKCVEATSLPIGLYAGGLSAVVHPIGPYGIPLRIFDQLADLDQVVAVKLTQPIPPAAAFEVAECLGDRLVIGAVNLELWPFLARDHDVSWSGQWNVEAVQSPERQYAVELVALLAERRFEPALPLFESFRSLHQAFYDVQARCITNGAHPVAFNKYYQWCTGGNGGLPLSTPHGNQPTLDESARDAIGAAYRAVGITPRDAPYEEFVVGRCAYERGVRAADVESGRKA